MISSEGYLRESRSRRPFVWATWCASGPFASFTGQVEGINQVKSLLKVAVMIFGQAQHVRLRFLDVEKI